MKRILLILIVVLTSCSESEETVLNEKTIDIELKSPELDFYGISNKSLTNIQVGDMIKINLEILQLKGADIIEIKPISKATSFHELINTDYELYIPSLTDPDKFTKVTLLTLKLGVNTFYIKPLLPGTFQLKFEEVTKTYDIFAPVVFSAVKINTRVVGNIDGNCGFSRWRRHTYYFSIDSGNQTFDLLFNEIGVTYAYETSYRGTSKSSPFSVKNEFKIIEDVSECGDYPSLDPLVKTITITKVSNGNKQIVATYNDIAVTN